MAARLELRNKRPGARIKIDNREGKNYGVVMKSDADEFVDRKL